MNVDVREGMIPGSEARFIAGYQTVRQFDDEHSQRVGIYRLFFGLEDAVDQRRQGREDGVSAALERLERMLCELD